MVLAHTPAHTPAVPACCTHLGSTWAAPGQHLGTHRCTTLAPSSVPTYPSPAAGRHGSHAAYRRRGAALTTPTHDTHTQHTHTTPSSQPPPAARAAVQRLQDHAYHAHQTLSVAPSLATIFEPPLPNCRRSLSRCPCSSRGRRTRCRPRGGRRGPWRARPTAAWSTCRARAASDTTTT